METTNGTGSSPKDKISPKTEAAIRRIIREEIESLLRASKPSHGLDIITKGGEQGCG